jgi:hypothetical protein
MHTKYNTYIYPIHEAFPWEITQRGQCHMKLSPMGKCPIIHIDLFDVTVETIINVMNDLNTKIQMARFAFNP